MSAIERPESLSPHTEPAPRALAASPRPRVGRAFGVVFLAIVVLVVAGALPKLKRREALARTQEEVNGPRRVLTGKVTTGPTRMEVTLPGSVAPFQSTPLYAKVTGFVRAYTVDLGDHVKAGELLAVIDAPETKEELKLAEARKHEAEVNLEISKVIADRNEQLSKSGLVSTQEADQQRARTNSAFAALGSSAAEVGRLGALVGYQRVVAPFDGVIVRRGIEKGTLVTPSASGTILFEVAKLDMLKVFVDVPQAFASFVKIDGTASVFAPSAPKVVVEGKIARTSGALDAATRTLRAEIHVPGNGPLLSGSFVDVRLAVDRASPPVVVPAAALVYRKEGTRLATLDASNTVTLKKITIGRDSGKELEVLEGVSAGETVVVNPPDDLVDGMVVLPVEAKSAEAKGNGAR